MGLKQTVARDRMVSRLKCLGLSTHEALTYTTLLSIPGVAASRVCQETGIPDSKIYQALDGLTKKGMIVVQRGNPNIYMPLSPGDAISSLKVQLTQAFHERMSEADTLVDMLAPIYEGAERSGEYEIAYIIRGQSNIIKRMKALIESAKREITIFIAYPEVFRGVKSSLIEARRERKVRLRIALAKEVLEKEDSSNLSDVHLVNCRVDSLGMLISDMSTLLTVSSWIDGAAMLTQDQNLIQVTQEYYDNPSCCVRVDE
jgi:sugar-specific transcriptional regulator TrmB